MPRKATEWHNAVADFETDPFKHGRTPEPFCVELLTRLEKHVFWGDDCVQQFIDHLNETDGRYNIFMHNGGKFDFFLMLDHVDSGTPKIINGRLVKHTICEGRHGIQDSYAQMPVPLAASNSRKAKWQKQMRELFADDHKHDNDAKDCHLCREAFYHLFERETREQFKGMILDYLHDDCLDLADMVEAFNTVFPGKITIGGAAISELLKRHPVERMNASQDKFYRQWYFGGRVQHFEKGILRGPWKAYDCNSMYPSVMRNTLHPINAHFTISKRLPDDMSKPFFAIIDARNEGALPWRDQSETLDGDIEYGEIDFTRRAGRFFATNHEIAAAMEFGALKIDKVHEVHIADEFGTFADFIDHFYAIRMEALARGDEVYKLLWKLVMNSAYGKFGQDPENYSDWFLTRGDIPAAELMKDGYTQWHEYPDYELWSKPARIHSKSYYDVSIAASITSAARASLFRALMAATDPIYCDTDSVICRAFAGDIDSKRLGAWKCEAEATHVAIAGKKLYALYNAGKPKPLVKIASKGVKLSLSQLIEIAEGGEIFWENPAPTFSFRAKPPKGAEKGQARFIKRKVRMTA